MAGRASCVLILLLAIAGFADVLAAGGATPSSSQVSTTTAAELKEVNGMLACMIGCFTQMFGCAFGCMAKGPDTTLCVVSCNQNSIVCMVRCALTPPPPKPKPTPPPPAPTPKPPAPSPSPPPPKAAGHGVAGDPLA
ncbi:Os02g0520500 [Oryza sativa Japonica Group]|uniref:Os02g0520500 protein n=2 Tax=Oryza sativa subsp. japonica TaxID=39947 RepID=Q0E0V0_ORYSJ|nr:Os02g0520500 [Oryza sativa Japonica Group]BAS78947.1 Os02g0520500 [Oryza sativa Japonica Group]|eukprot:NP_001046974.1 Os02g0520500 [Oryza sativa Japonica Group]